MEKNLSDLFKVFGEISTTLSGKEVSQEQIDDFVSRIRGYKVQKLSPKKNNDIQSSKTHYDAQEMADHLKVNRETIYRWCKQLQVYKSKRNCPKLGNSYRFPIADVTLFETEFVSFCQELPFALCIINTIYFNSEKGDIAVFSQGDIYRIIEENNNWCYLINKDWGGTFKISKKQLKKNFSVDGEQMYEARKYNIY